MGTYWVPKQLRKPPRVVRAQVGTPTLEVNIKYHFKLIFMPTLGYKVLSQNLSRN